MGFGSVCKWINEVQNWAKATFKISHEIKKQTFSCFPSLPTNIKGSELYWWALAVGSESPYGTVQFVPGKGRAHLQQLKWKCRNPTLFPLVLQGWRWDVLAEVLLEAPTRYIIASRQFQPLLICKHKYSRWKTWFAELCSSNGRENRTVQPLCSATANQHGSKSRDQILMMKGLWTARRLWTKAPAGVNATDVSANVPSREFAPQNYSKQLFSE